MIHTHGIGTINVPIGPVVCTGRHYSGAKTNRKDGEEFLGGEEEVWNHRTKLKKKQSRPEQRYWD